MTSKSAIRAEYPLGPALDFLQRLWQLNHALESLSSRMEKRLGVTAQQRLIVRCVAKYPGIAAGQLAALLHVDPGTVSAALTRLEGKHLIERRRDQPDKRRTSVGLTPKARALDRPTRGTVESAVERLLQQTSTKQIGNAVGVMEKLTEALGEELGGA